MSAPASLVDLYRDLRRLGRMGPVEATSTIVDMTARDIAAAVAVAAGNGNGVTITVDNTAPLMRRYRTACEWQAQAQRLTHRRLRAYVNAVDAPASPQQRSETVWVPTWDGTPT